MPLRITGTCQPRCRDRALGRSSDVGGAERGPVGGSETRSLQAKADATRPDGAQPQRVTRARAAWSHYPPPAPLPRPRLPLVLLSPSRSQSPSELAMTLEEVGEHDDGSEEIADEDGPARDLVEHPLRRDQHATREEHLERGEEDHQSEDEQRLALGARDQERADD